MIRTAAAWLLLGIVIYGLLVLAGIVGPWALIRRDRATWEGRG
jgi:hypothetical protein